MASPHSTKLEPADYTVSAWSKFEWSENLLANAKARKQVEENLDRAAGVISAAMSRQAPQQRIAVRGVRVDSMPQLLFVGTFRAIDVADARKRALYRFDRGRRVRVAWGRGPRRGLSFNWGDVQIERQQVVA